MPCDAAAASGSASGATAVPAPPPRLARACTARCIACSFCSPESCAASAPIPGAACATAGAGPCHAGVQPMAPTAPCLAADVGGSRTGAQPEAGCAAAVLSIVPNMCDRKLCRALGKVPLPLAAAAAVADAAAGPAGGGATARFSAAAAVDAAVCVSSAAGPLPCAFSPFFGRPGWVDDRGQGAGATGTPPAAQAGFVT
eukprot:365668-Chlamydomonas_euryale.AAC.8